MNPRPGEVWMADLGFAAKYRPVVIVSRQDSDPPRALITYVPVTTTCPPWTRLEPWKFAISTPNTRSAHYLGRPLPE